MGNMGTPGSEVSFCRFLKSFNEPSKIIIPLSSCVWIVARWDRKKCEMLSSNWPSTLLWSYVVRESRAKWIKQKEDWNTCSGEKGLARLVSWGKSYQTISKFFRPYVYKQHQHPTFHHVMCSLYYLEFSAKSIVFCFFFFGHICSKLKIIKFVYDTNYWYSRQYRVHE